MSVTEEYLRHAAGYAQEFTAGDLPLPPGRGTAVVACMDARLDVYGLLGLSPGDSHVIRNAGGVVTEDVLRSLAISQRLLGTREILLVHHTDCGMLTFTDEEFRQSLLEATGRRPDWASRAFPDLEQDVREGLAAVRADPFLVAVDAVWGFVYDVRTGVLAEVEAG